MFFVLNYLSNDNPFLHLWFLSMDFQLYLLSPVVLYPLKKFGFKWYPVLILFFIPSIYVIMSTEPGSKGAIYFATHTRYTPWLIGLMLGHFLCQQETKKPKISTWLISAAWAVTLAYLFFLISVLKSIHLPFLNAMHRPMCGLCVCWVVASCQMGYTQSLNTFLSKRFFQPLAVLSYSMFISHYPILKLMRLTQRAPIYRNEWLLSLEMIEILAISFVAGLICSLCFEFPIAALYRIFLTRHTKVSENDTNGASNLVGVDADISAF